MERKEKEKEKKQSFEFIEREEEGSFFFSIALKIAFNRFLNHQFHNESLHFALQL